jgi:hypothetical protein
VDTPVVAHTPAIANVIGMMMGHDQVRDGSARRECWPRGPRSGREPPEGEIPQSTIVQPSTSRPQPTDSWRVWGWPTVGSDSADKSFHSVANRRDGCNMRALLEAKKENSGLCIPRRATICVPQNSGIASISLADVPDFPCQRYLGSRSYDWKQWRQRDEPEAVGIHGKTPARRLD